MAAPADSEAELSALLKKANAACKVVKDYNVLSSDELRQYIRLEGLPEMGRPPKSIEWVKAEMEVLRQATERIKSDTEQRHLYALRKLSISEDSSDDEVEVGVEDRGGVIVIDMTRI